MGVFLLLFSSKKKESSHCALESCAQHIKALATATKVKNMQHKVVGCKMNNSRCSIFLQNCFGVDA